LYFLLLDCRHFKIRDIIGAFSPVQNDLFFDSSYVRALTASESLLKGPGLAWVPVKLTIKLRNEVLLQMRANSLRLWWGFQRGILGA